MSKNTNRSNRLFIIALALLSLASAGLFFVSLTGKFVLPFYSVDKCKSRLDSCISECKKTPIESI
jgi:hypothetical protein